MAITPSGEITWGVLPSGCLDRIVVCSPHFDDAALGAAHMLFAHPGSTVVTAFGGPPGRYPDPPTEWDALGGFRSGDDVVALRRGEDRDAMAVLDAQPVWLEFVDHQYLARAERSEPKEIAAALAEVLAEAQPTAVFLPMGLANPDHVALHDAGMLLAPDRPDISWFCYEDSGYKHIPGLLAWRIGRLFRSDLWPTPMIVPVVVDHDRKRAAIECYRSQLAPLNRDHSLGARIGGGAPEQFWLLAPTARLGTSEGDMSATMEVPVLPAGAEVAEVEGALRESGCAVVERLASAEQMDRIESELEPFLRVTPIGGDEFTGFRTRRTGSLLARSPGFGDLAAHPLVLGVLDGVLGDHATSYQLHLTQVIEIGPDEPAQIVHRDQWAFDFFPFPAGFEVECHTMWAMNDFTGENGATRVIPGSHRFADKLRPTVDETIAAEMPKGSVLLYLGSLYHGGGANRSTSARRGVNVGYTLSWLRQEENQYLACPPEVARELPEELARLAGYRPGAYALGYYGDLRDPFDAVRGEVEAGPATFAPRS